MRFRLFSRFTTNHGSKTKIMNLQVGQTYRLRNGLKAEVTSHDPDEPYPFAGWIDPGLGQYFCCWTEEGRYFAHAKEEMAEDIVALWEEPK